MKIIESIEHWNILAAAMRDKGYTLWQMQYNHVHHEGFHAWFYKSGKDDVEVVTHNRAVEMAIVNYNSSFN